MRKLLLALPILALAGCGSTSGVTVGTVATVAADSTACLLAADAVATDSNTLANTEAVAAVLATNPACVGLAQSVLTAIQNAEAPAPASVVVAPVAAPVSK